MQPHLFLAKEAVRSPQICTVTALDLFVVTSKIISNYPFDSMRLRKSSLASPTALAKYQSIDTVIAHASEYIESIYQ